MVPRTSAPPRPNLTLFRRSVELMKFPAIAFSAFLAATPVTAEESGGTSPGPARQAEPSISTEEIYSLGKSLFDTYAPESIKAEYDFISPEAFSALTGRVQSALESDSWAALVSCVPALREALATARSTPGGADWAGWLGERLDLAEAAEEILGAQRNEDSPAPVPLTAPTPTPTPTPTLPATVPRPPDPKSAPVSAVPHLAHWQKRLAGRPLPPRALELLPLLKSIFEHEGLPAELVWLVEVESSFNPKARSPAGAKGLFQLMPATAESLGLSTLFPDERTEPVKSARAAATLLRVLHARFEDWALALAAYNAGEGRVRRALAARQGKTFADVSLTLPTETQLYVPKVLATVAHREGIDPLSLPAPTALR